MKGCPHRRGGLVGTSRGRIASYFLWRQNDPQCFDPAGNYCVHRRESPRVQRQQNYSTENENGARDHCDGNRHGCESDCAANTSDDCVGDCEKDDDGANETSHAAGYGQSRDNGDRGIEKTW